MKRRARAISLADIHQAIAALDPEGAYRQISYNLTARNTLNAHSPWWVSMPYGGWRDPSTAPNPSPLQQAILQAIPDGGAPECFIDILHLSNSSTGFFKDDKASRQIATALAAFVNGMAPETTPVIRYLVGNPWGEDPAQDELLQTLFYSGLVKHPNAWLYHGNFTPGLQLSQEMAAVAASLVKPALADVWHWLRGEIQTLSVEMSEEVNRLEAEITGWMGRFRQPVSVPPLCWNHAKIFAVNGTHLVTGGANYWDDYTTGQTETFDMAMSITGDAAVDAHRFADYLWRYLGNIPATDTTSWSRGKRFGDASPAFPHAVAPPYSGSPRNTGDLAALSVGRNGLWPNDWMGYPVQVFEAARDFVLNAFAAMVETHLSARTDLIARLAAALSDDNPEIRGVMGRLGINPAAWATRYARNYAIRNARRVVRLEQQKLVLDEQLAARHQDYLRLVAEVNRMARIDWDGLIWPFDTLLALGYALAGIRRHRRDATAAVQIVASYHNPEMSGVPDAVTAARFKARLAVVMRGMSAAGAIDVPPQEVEPLVSAGVAYKRIDASPAGWRHASHSKLVIVDDAVCYIGSDPAYPSYNQEFGLWLDDAASVRALVSQHWRSLWKVAREGP